MGAKLLRSQSFSNLSDERTAWEHFLRPRDATSKQRHSQSHGWQQPQKSAFRPQPPSYSNSQATTRKIPQSHTVAAVTTSRTHLRTSSPLSPERRVLPPRACFPRSRREPSLYRLAIITRLKTNTIMEPRSTGSASVAAATRALEEILNRVDDH